jgi:hypothetical protein
MYVQSPGPAGCQLAREPWALTMPTVARATKAMDGTRMAWSE